MATEGISNMRDDLRRSLGRRWRSFVATPHNADSERLWADIRARHPGFVDAVLADARITAARRGDRAEFTSTFDAVLQAVRLAVVSDAFLALTCYRAKAALQARRVPLLPRILHRLAIMTGQLSVGDPVTIEAGVYIPHGQVVIDGLVTVGRGAVLSPFVTIGLIAGKFGGPTIGRHAAIGTGAKILGPVRVGRLARVGANAVVLDDVPDGATAIGVPAHVI